MTELIVDVAKLDGDGAFPCPNCNAILSPDDETERVYTVLGCGEDGVRLRCRCGAEVRVVSELMRMQKDLAGKGIVMEKVKAK